MISVNIPLGAAYQQIFVVGILLDPWVCTHGGRSHGGRSLSLSPPFFDQTILSKEGIFQVTNRFRVRSQTSLYCSEANYCHYYYYYACFYDFLTESIHVHFSSLLFYFPTSYSNTYPLTHWKA